MRKTNSFISVSDLISIGIYIAVTIAVDVGFGMFIYMMVIWIFLLYKIQIYLKN